MRARERIVDWSAALVTRSGSRIEPSLPGDVAGELALVPVETTLLARLRHLEPPDRRQVFLSDVRPRWLRACAGRLEDDYRKQGHDERQIQETDFLEMARRRWRELGLEAAYLQILTGFEKRLRIVYRTLSAALLTAGAASVLAAVVAAGSVHRRQVDSRVAFLRQAYDEQERHYRQTRDLPALLAQIYDRHAGAASKQGLLEEITKLLFFRDVERPEGPPTPQGDAARLKRFFEGLKGRRPRSGGLFGRIPYPELHDAALRRSLRRARQPKELDPRLFFFLAQSTPYTGVEAADYERLKLLHAWAYLPEAADGEGRASRLLKHLDKIRSRILDLGDRRLLAASETERLLEWIDSGCRPDGGTELAWPLDERRAEGLFGLIDDLQGCEGV